MDITNQIITRSAPAKLNLYLHIVGQRADGYHLLDSLFAFTQNGDEITVRGAPELSLEVTGPFAGSLAAVGGLNADNLVMKAALLLRSHAGIKNGAAISLSKNLPIASGIGGGSADAAATLLALNDLWQLDLSLETLSALALRLGADVPACLHDRPLHVSGIGEQIKASSLPKDYGILLVNSGEALSTPAVFQAFHAEGYKPSLRLPCRQPKESADFIKWLLEKTSNDLQAPAVSLCPAIAPVMRDLSAINGALMVRMSGSGATCFALFQTVSEAKQAQIRIEADHPKWWVMADQLVP